MEEAVGFQPIAHRVGEAGQLDAVGAHDANAAELQALGEIEDGAAVHQGGEGALRVSVGVSVASAVATQAGETLRPMMRSPASV